MQRWWKDPLWLFLLVGALLLVIAEWWPSADESYRIEVTDLELARLSDQWQMQMQRPPTEAELSGLVDAFIREEVYYREAQRLGLDAGDTIIRRRLVQKLTFVTEDLATALEPEDAVLRAYYEDELDRYTLPERLSFRHRYFSVDRREDAESDAAAALADDSIQGDPFMLQRSYAERSQRQVGDLFGRRFAEDLFALDGDGWLGPVRSAYGWHAVQIEGRSQPEAQAFEAIRSRVLADYQMQQRKQANEQYFQSLADQYEIVYPDRSGG